MGLEKAGRGVLRRDSCIRACPRSRASAKRASGTIKTTTPASETGGDDDGRGLGPIVGECREMYERGVRVAREEYRAIAERLERSATLSKWSLRITPG